MLMYLFDKKYSNIVKFYYSLKLHNIKKMYSYDGIFITPVFIVTWSFSNYSNKMICC